ncbi:ThiF family adenylyltransferase [Mesobacillus subterraneus]|uniref:ThiF family adenylyltransferase n=1 Tax=Mesobacillus subterraneus TaxID=285983 RepID=UPI00273D485F|nr:ThiF family adenylyltransferase [Mesobacillus subterraneus]WLR55669.1 ThiF family adenylyltransferase [Mesobacillus subterraneus]
MKDLERYSRQILFQPVGRGGQEKLLKSSAVIVGMGALGTVISNHLVRSGVGHVRIIDRDLVELSNLQRQTLYDEDDAGENLPKVIAAEKKLKKINSEIKVEPIIADLTLDNAEDLLAGFDVIVDGTDNFMDRYLINDVAAKHGIPWVYGGAVSSRGMFAAIKPGETPCYRCLFPSVPAGLGETCDSIGVLSPITDIIGSFEAVEAIKLLVGAESNPNLEQMDIWYNSFLQMDISGGRNPECPACVHHNYEFLDRSSDQQINFVSLCGRNTIQINPRQKIKQNLEKLAGRLKNNGEVKGNPFLLRFMPDEEITMVIFQDGRVLVHGTNDTVKAKSYYARYLGS